MRPNGPFHKTTYGAEGIERKQGHLGEEGGLMVSIIKGKRDDAQKGNERPKKIEKDTNAEV